jgi:SAM-dependent methyltransferase
MIICSTCGGTLETIDIKCSECGHEVVRIDGILALAPELAHGGGGFEADAFARLYEQESKHFWFRVRNDLLLNIIRRYKPDVRSFFEIGCGTGYVMHAIAQEFPESQISGGEVFVNGLSFAGLRVPRAMLMQIDARKLPFVEEYDLIGMFDVLEHIPEDEQVLENVYRALKPGGMLLCSVPQHMWMWSDVDTFSHHARRYERGELERKGKKAGFQVVRSTSFMSFLLPIMYVSRLQQRSRMKRADGMGEYNISPLVNSFFEAVCRFELLWINAGFSFPFGGSRIVLLQKS